MSIKYLLSKNAFSYQKVVGIVVLLLTGLLFGVTQQQVNAAPAGQTGPTTWTVLVGGQAGIEPTEQGPMGAWQFMRFYPESITINAGDTIVWKLNSAEPHTITFPQPGQASPELVVPASEGSQDMMFNPLAVMPQGQATYDGTTLTGSGQLGGEAQFPTEYKLTFTTPGTYEYFCAFHQMMKGTVIVQAAGTPYPQTQAQIDAAAAQQLAADTQAATKAEAEIKNTPATTRLGPNGTTIYEVKMGYGDAMLAFMRFTPTDLTVHVGDTVEWTQTDVETPHTITLTSGGEEPAMVVPEPQTAGPPKLLLNPKMMLPAGGTTYSGQGYFNSGLIWGTKAPMPGPRTYSLTFDTPGTYEYICILHDMMGMNGHITVLAQDAPAQLPVTGGSSIGFDPLWSIGFGLGLVVVGVSVAVFKRRQTKI